jgi:hypothetical protein
MRSVREWGKANVTKWEQGEDHTRIHLLLLKNFHKFNNFETKHLNNVLYVLNIKYIILVGRSKPCRLLPQGSDFQFISMDEVNKYFLSSAVSKKGAINKTDIGLEK